MEISSVKVDAWVSPEVPKHEGEKNGAIEKKRPPENRKQKTIQEISEKEILRAIEEANQSLKAKYTRFEFSIHEGTRQIMVKVFDRDTDELIREIPPEEILDMVAKLWELAGILVDERV